MTQNVADGSICQTGFRPHGNGCGPNTVVCVDLAKHGLCTYFSHHIPERIDATRTVFVPDVVCRVQFTPVTLGNLKKGIAFSLEMYKRRAL